MRLLSLACTRFGAFEAATPSPKAGCMMRNGTNRVPTLLPALLFGVGTLFVPFLIMHPAFGLGVAASKAPNRVHARLKSLMAHTAFGIGLYAVSYTHLTLP